MDWGDGDYTRTAELLMPVSESVVEVCRVARGQRVLDVGCGTGNGLLAAARRGASVTGVDPSARLLEIARGRLDAAGVEATLIEGTAEAMDVAAGAADVVVSIFAVIFGPDPDAAVAGMARAAAPGGRVAVTSWREEGPMAEAARMLREAVPSGDGPPRSWHETAWVAELMGRHGLTADATERHVTMRADSPEAFVADLEVSNPAWRTARANSGEERWSALRKGMIDAFHDGNLDPGRLRIDVPYLLTIARV